jgi:transposase
MSKDGILGIQIFSSAVKGKDFACFLINLIKNSERIKSNLKDTYFFMDNAAIHKSKITKNFLESLNIIYNAPYSPDLNPIENLFGRVKKEFRRLNLTNENNILLNIFKSFKSVSNMYLYSYVVQSMKFYDKAIKLEPF